MHVALFTDSYLPTRDGVVSSILAYRRGLGEKRHKVFVFAPEIPGSQKESRVFRFRSVRFPPYPEYHAAVFPHVSSRMARELGIDIVHCKAVTTMGLSAMWFASRARLPSIASLETMVPDGMHYISPDERVQNAGRRFLWSYLRWFYSNFDLVTAPSRHAQRLLSENGVESTVLPSPVDTCRFRPDEKAGRRLRKSLGFGKRKVILSVGRVVKEKNYSLLLKAAKKMDHDALFVVAGSGPHLPHLKRETEKAGLKGRFHFAGFVPDSEMAGYYNMADAFVFPSKFETQGLTLLEALACGKPACVLRGTPMEEIIREGKNGFSFADEEECAEKLEECAANGKSMSASARKTALEYSIPKCTARLLSLYGRLL